MTMAAPFHPALPNENRTPEFVKLPDGRSG